MAMNHRRWRSFASMAAAGILLFFLSHFPLSASASASASPGAVGIESQHPGARELLQAHQSCPVNFEFANYTVLTSQCKGPLYKADVCCAAFTEFACPYAEYLNDLTNDCATTMFSYINLNGKYPPGLFSSECKGSKQGLVCPAGSPTQVAAANGAPSTSVRVLSLLLSASFLTIVLQLL